MMPSYTIAEHPPPSWRKQNKAKGGTHKLMNFPGLFMLQNQSENYDGDHADLVFMVYDR